METEKKEDIVKKKLHGNIKYDESFKLQVVRETIARKKQGESME